MRTALSRSTTFGLLASALALAGATLALTPAQAVAASQGFSARLSAPLAAPKQMIINEALWKCAGDACTAPGGGSRPVLVCQQVAKKFGEVAAFTSPMGTMSAEELAKCNKR